MIKKDEISTIFLYLTGLQPDNRQVTLYTRGVNHLQLHLNQIEQTILDWCLKHPGTIRVVDNGLALFMKNSNLRNRLLLATAIIECDQINRHRFLNEVPVRLSGLKFIFAAGQSACLMVTAFILFKWKGWK